MNKLLDGKSILITGGTGSLGSAVVSRIVTGEFGEPDIVAILSRDELKQSIMASEYKHKPYMRFIIGDVRNFHSVYNALWKINYVIHAAAMKRVESCEQYPIEAFLTNCLGTANVVNAVKASLNSVECVVGISSDKGADPINTYGTTKALQEQIILAANNNYAPTRFVCVRYGNVMGSRGSVIPIWKEQIRRGDVLTIREPGMTRFFISLNQAVNTIIAAFETARGGDVYIPHSLPVASIGDLADIIIGNKKVQIVITGKGAGEKDHETLVTNYETKRTLVRGQYYVVTNEIQDKPVLIKEYVSNDYVITKAKLKQVLIKQGIIEM